MFNHETVLLNESVDLLNVKADGVYVDATLGGAGHSSLIYSKLNEKGKLILFDQDITAIENAKKIFAGKQNVFIVNSNFVNLKRELEKLGINKIDGILFDLGVSSMQIDVDERGFSYMNDGPLDMRMDKDAKLTAYDVINEYSFHELQNIFKKYGEEEFAKQMIKMLHEESLRIQMAINSQTDHQEGK